MMKSWNVVISSKKNKTNQKQKLDDSTLLTELGLSDPCDIMISYDAITIVGNYFVADFIVGFFKAAILVLEGSVKETILLQLGPEQNTIERKKDRYYIKLWDIPNHKYQEINCDYDNYIAGLYSVKKEYERHLMMEYKMKNVHEFQLFHLGLYSKIK